MTGKTGPIRFSFWIASLCCVSRWILEDGALSPDGGALLMVANIVGGAMVLAQMRCSLMGQAPCVWHAS